MRYETEMPFGKYKGYLLPDIPPRYLAWVLRNCRNIDPGLRRAIRLQLDPEADLVEEAYQRGWSAGHAAGYELGKRLAGQSARRSSTRPALDVQRWFRRLAARWHPDAGGTKESMQAIEAARSLLEQQLGDK